MTKIIGKIAAIEKIPTTIDEFSFWTEKELILNPFDVVKVNHIKDSITYGVIEEISHITDAASFLSSFISSDFGDVEQKSYSARIGMNYVKAKVIGNTKNIYTPVLDGNIVSLGDKREVTEALGLDEMKNPLPGGYLEMYEGDDKIQLPVHFNSHFLIGPEGAHLNISGISGLAAKTSYTMFLLKAIQEQFINNKSNESIAFVILNVKGADLLAIDEPNLDLKNEDFELYRQLGMTTQPFQNVKYCYPYHPDSSIGNTYGKKNDVESQFDSDKAWKYKYTYQDDKDKLDLLFSNVDDSSGTMDSIISEIMNENGAFAGLGTWNELLKEINERCQKQNNKDDKSITLNSWRKFHRIIRRIIKGNDSLFANSIDRKQRETRVVESIYRLSKNDVLVIDIAKLDEDMQAFVFGDAIRAIYDMKLGQSSREDDENIPSKIIVFIDELNKYASKDVPKGSPILRHILDITERGRSLGIILFSAEQFKSSIHDRVKGNCATHAYGRTNAIELSQKDYSFIPSVYKGMMTRLKQGEYIIQNPVFRSLLNIKFPKPLYKQYKNG